MIIRCKHAQAEVWTPAKLNLFLEVLSRRNDGFHEIETLMIAIAIYDTLEFESTPAKSASEAGSLSLQAVWTEGLAARARQGEDLPAASPWGDLPVGEDNLALQAVRKLRERAGETRGAKLRLVKRIPSAAGLGGASSDAAAALVAANRAWGLDWSREKLAELAAEIGSDVPFFLGGQAALCRGRGERIEVIEDIPPVCLVVARPPAGLATAEVYRACRPASRPCSPQALVGALRRGDIAAAGREMTNRLEPAAASVSPWPGRMRREFERLGLPGHQMTGSGSCYFGLCRNMSEARGAASRLAGRGVGHVTVTRSLGTAIAGIQEVGNR